MTKQFMLIGAELASLSYYANEDRTRELRQELTKLGLSFVGVQNI